MEFKPRNHRLDVAYIVCTILIQHIQVHCYPNGGLYKNCVNLLPKHHTQQQSGPPPYFKMEVSQDEYAPGDNITIRLYSTSSLHNPFRGYQVMAQRAEGDMEELLGEFTSYPNDAKTFSWYAEKINCVTHSNNADKTEIILQWTAPPVSEGTIVIHAAFVETYKLFWANVTHTLTPKVPADKEKLHDFPWKVNTETFDPMTVDECGKSKGCLYHPLTCTGADCTYLLTYKTDANLKYIDFEIMGRANGYLSVAFSKDPMMGKDESITCVLKDHIAHIQHGYNPFYYNERIRNSHLSDIQMKRDGDAMYCRFRRPLAVTLSLFKSTSTQYPPTSYNKTYDLNEEYFLHLGWGGLYEGSDVIGKHVELPLVTSSAVNFKKNEILYGHAIPMEIQAHAAMTLIAWVALAGFAMIISRHYKDAMSNRCCGGKIWFQVHRVCMFLVAALTAAAFIWIFIYVGDWKDLATLHAAFGIAVMAITLFQILVALCRPDPDSSKRPVFNWFHRISGKLAHICAAVSMLLGVNLSLMPLKFQSAETIILGVWVGAQVLWEIVFEVMKCRRDAAAKKSVNISMDNLSKGDSKSSQSELTGALEKNGGCLYAVALTLYTLSLLVFLAASVSLLFIF